MKLEVHEAELSTASVEIKTLTVSGKQVTLAVFRQLEETRIFDELFGFRGRPWGRVNYHPDKCIGAGEHLHVVWQFGTELRRANVEAPLERRMVDHLAYQIDEGSGGPWLRAAIGAGWRPRHGIPITSPLSVKNRCGVRLSLGHAIRRPLFSSPGPVLC